VTYIGAPEKEIIIEPLVEPIPGPLEIPEPVKVEPEKIPA
jgi:hypothetical protein